MKSNQSGSVLAISLVLLTAITLIAMMNMQRSGLQTKIVANLQHDEKAFTAALNLLEAAYSATQVSDTQILNEAINAQNSYQHQTNIGADLTNTPSSVDMSLGTPLSANVTGTTMLHYKPNGNDLGSPNTSGLRNDFSRGKGGTGIAKFEIEAIARLPNDIQSDQFLGFHLMTPQQ